MINDSIAAEKEGRVHQVYRQPGSRHLPQQQTHAAGTEAAAEFEHRIGVQHGVQHLRQAGQQQPHVGALPGQRRRQGGHDIGQATGLDQRKDLGRHVQHAHRRRRGGHGRCGGRGGAAPGGRRAHCASACSMSRVTSVMPVSVR